MTYRGRGRCHMLLQQVNEMFLIQNHMIASCQREYWQ